MSCPLWRGKCREHKCDWYIQLLGSHPQTGEQINKWGCAVAWLPVLLVENSQMQRQTGAAVESFRNENSTVNQAAISLMNGVLNAAKSLPPASDSKLIEG